ncbi:MAG: hypothetical protein ACK4Z7_12915 [Novosphingobium sp.]
MKRFVWLAVLGLLAVVAAGAQLDRASRRQPALAPLVPPVFRSFAQERLTIATVRSASPEAALADARTLVSRSPLPAEHLTLLAIASERNGDRQGSALLVQRAAQRGWRDPIAQQAMFDIALAAGDEAEAARRLAALFGVQEDQAPLKDMAARLVATPEGRQALAATMAAGGNWTKAFLRQAAGDLTPSLAETIVMAQQAGARPDCAAAQAAKRAFIAKGRAAEAALLDRCTARRR